MLRWIHVFQRLLHYRTSSCILHYTSCIILTLYINRHQYTSIHINTHQYTSVYTNIISSICMNVHQFATICINMQMAYASIYQYINTHQYTSTSIHINIPVHQYTSIYQYINTHQYDESIFIGKMLVPLGWYPSCLTPQGAL